MLRPLLFVLTAFTLISGQAMAQGVDLSLSNDSVQARVSTLAGNPTGMGNSEMDMGALYTSGRGAAKDNLLGMLGIMVIGNAGTGAPELDVGVGVKLFAASVDNDSLAALAVGSRLRFHPKALNRLSFTAEVHYAPDIVTFVDAQSFLYSAVRIEYEVLPQALVYVGYRNIRADLSNGPNATLDNGGHIGLQLIY